MAIARFAASASTAGGRDNGWASGPVMPFWQELLLQLEHELAVFRVHGRHGAQFQRARKLFIRISSSAMMAFLYAMKCLKLFTPCSRTSVPMSACTLSSHQVTATWKV